MKITNITRCHECCAVIKIHNNVSIDLKSERVYCVQCINKSRATGVARNGAN